MTVIHNVNRQELEPFFTSHTPGRRQAETLYAIREIFWNELGSKRDCLART